MRKYCSPVGDPRKIVEKEIGRKLGKDEEVHHINGCRKDNRPANLSALKRKDHKALHAGKPRQHLKKCLICGLSKRDTEFVHVRISRANANALKRIAAIHHRTGIQIDANLAILEYVRVQEALRNRKDNGR